MSEELEGIHKLIWSDVAYLTDSKGNRYKIDNSTDLNSIKAIVHLIKSINIH